jgi:hypothetical protein
MLFITNLYFQTCPVSRRKRTARCDSFFQDMVNTPPHDYRNIAAEKLEQILDHFNKMFLPAVPVSKTSLRPKKYSSTYTIKNPTFEYGVLSSKNVPPVKIIDVKQQTKAPLVILPVYMRMGNSSLGTTKGIFLTTPFLLHGKIMPSTTESLKKP